MRIIFNHQSVARRARWCSSVRFVARTSRPFAETHSRRFVRFRRGRTRTLSSLLPMSMMDDVSVVMMAMATTANNTVFATVLLLLLFDA